MQIWQDSQNSSAPKRSGAVATSGMSVVTPARRTPDPKCRLMSDPSFLVTSPTASDPSLAPAGRSAYYVLFPTPNLDGPVDWRVERDRYLESVVRTVEARPRRLNGEIPAGVE